MALSPEEKSKRRRERMIQKAKEYTPTTYIRKFVAPEFQRMIRAEYGARTTGFTTAVKNGQIVEVLRMLGECVCVTCGTVYPWSGERYGGALDTGHFIGSRRNAILFEEDNVAPQCVSCNRYHGGRPSEYRVWMECVYGIETIERLERLRNETRRFTREELVEMRITHKNRLDTAIERMG